MPAAVGSLINVGTTAPAGIAAVATEVRRPHNAE
jgi:hypothetical protein